MKKVLALMMTLVLLATSNVWLLFMLLQAEKSRQLGKTKK